MNIYTFSHVAFVGFRLGYASSAEVIPVAARALLLQEGDLRGLLRRTADGVWEVVEYGSGGGDSLAVALYGEGERLLLVASYGETTGYGTKDTGPASSYRGRGRQGPAVFKPAFYTDSRSGGTGGGQSSGKAPSQRGDDSSGPADRVTDTGSDGQTKKELPAGNQAKQAAARSGPAVSARTSSRPSSAARAENALLTKQSLLLTMIVDEPSVFPLVKKYLTPSDFTDALFRTTAAALWEQMEHGGSPASAALVIAAFETPEEQEKAAAVLSTRAEGVNSGAGPDPGGLSRTLRELVIAVKEASIDRMSRPDGEEQVSLGELLEAKKQLQMIRSARFNI